MNRTFVSKEELANIFTTKLKSCKHLDGDCRDCHSPGFYRLVEADAEGCNWTVNGYAGPEQCIMVVMKIIDSLRNEYNLKD